MKRISILLLVIVLITSALGPITAYGEEGYDKKLEDVIRRAKDLFNISNEYDKFTSSIDSYDGDIKFYLNWSDSKDNLKNINVIMDTEGNVISYNSYYSEYREIENKLPTYSKNEAEKFAMEFIGKVDPKVFKEIKPMKETYQYNSRDSKYHFNFERYVNDIKFSQNSVNISIDKYSGEIEYYYSNWDRKAIFPSPKKAITLEQGKEAYKEEVGIVPIYKSNFYYRPIDIGLELNEDQNNHYLAYSTLEAGKGIDAFTGKKVDISYYGPYYRMEATKDMDAGGLTEVEQQSVDKLTGILDEKTAEKKIREVFKIEDGYKLVNKNIYRNYRDQDVYSWNMYFQKEISKDQFQHMNGSIDAKTGEAINFYKTVEYKTNDKASINKDQALVLAKEYMKRIQPDKVEQVELMENSYEEDMQLSYHFRFIRKDGNVYVESDGIYIGVDAVNKEIISYNMDWFRGKLPSKDKLISADIAYDVLWDKIGLELVYVKTYDYTKPGEPSTKIELVYMLSPEKPAIIDGNTGEILDYTGKPYVEYKPISYIDLDNSYAKDKIKVLAEFGIGFKEEEFKPKEKIKQKDLLYLLWKSQNQYVGADLSEDNIYKEFIRLGYITEEEKDPNRIVIKEEAVKYILKMKQLDKVAELDIYKELFKDEKEISEGLKGYMNIAYGLRIILGDGKGNIGPKYELRREDAANMIYNDIFN